MRFRSLFILSLILSSCTAQQPKKSSTNSSKEAAIDSVHVQLFQWHDSNRKRSVPVAIYQPPVPNIKGLAIISHGYGQNRPGSYLKYSYLADALAKKGYLVASIQHELPTDSLMPTEGVAQIVRKPFWELGVQNILFVVNKLKETQKNIVWKEVILIGHSNGGDISSLYAHMYPTKISHLITLDNRRMPLPKKIGPAVLSFRSSDMLPDPGVVPITPGQKTKYIMHIIQLKNTKHDEMDDTASPAQRKEILDHLFRFLKIKREYLPLDI